MRQNEQSVGKLVEEKGLEYIFRHYALYQEKVGRLDLRRVEVVFPDSAQRKETPLLTILTVLYTPKEGLYEYGCCVGKGVDHPLIQEILQNDESNLAPKDGKKWMLFDQLIKQWQTARTIWQAW